MSPARRIENEPPKEATAVAYPQCPKCGWHNVRFSRRRGALTGALALVSVLPFRCRSCGHRFYRFYRR